MKDTPKTCTKLPENTDSNLTRPTCSRLFQIEVKLSALKSYVSCEIASLHSKIESILQSLQVTLEVFQERGKKTNEFFHQNLMFLQNELYHHWNPTNNMRQPRPQSNFLKIALAPHDFVRNCYLIWFVSFQQSKLIYAMRWFSIMADLSDKHCTVKSLGNTLRLSPSIRKRNSISQNAIAVNI